MRSFIYYLRDPSTNEVRYIGYSKDPKKRLIGHITEAQAENKNHRHHWILSLLCKNLRPVLEVVEQTRVPKKREIELIAEFRAGGVQLVNGTTGGDGVRGLKHTESFKRKMKRKLKALWKDPVYLAKMQARKPRPKHSPEENEACRKRMLRLNADPAFRAKKNSPQQREAVSKACKKRMSDPVEKKKVMDALQRTNIGNKHFSGHTHTPEAIAKSHTPELRLAQSLRMKKLWKDPEYQKKKLGYSLSA